MSDTPTLCICSLLDYRREKHKKKLINRPFQEIPFFLIKATTLLLPHDITLGDFCLVKVISTYGILQEFYYPSTTRMSKTLTYSSYV